MSGMAAKNQSNVKELEFTGEFFVPGKTDLRMEADHLERYRFACRDAFGKTVLDIACGAGYSAPVFLAAGATTYLGVDINAGLVEHAANSYGSETARFATGDITSFVSDRRFDLISCFETIEHVTDYKAAIRNLRRLLAPSGILLISSPNRRVTSPVASTLKDKPQNPFHVQEFLPDELLKELVEAGFSATINDVYGQRQSRVPSNRFLRFFHKAIIGNPKKKGSPAVTPLGDRTPRYFLIRATAPEVVKREIPSY